MMARRKFLGVLGVTGGGVGGLYYLSNEDDGDTESKTEASEDTSQPSSESQSDSSDESSTGGESPENSSDAGPEDDTAEQNTTESEGADDNESEANDTEGEREEDSRQHQPTEEDTQINREKYEQHGEREVEHRPAADIEDSVSSELRDDGTVYVEGSVKNISDEPIDVVDIEVLALSATDDVLYPERTAFEDGLAAGEEKTFSVTFLPHAVPGVIDSIQVNLYPMDYLDA